MVKLIRSVLLVALLSSSLVAEEVTKAYYNVEEGTVVIYNLEVYEGGQPIDRTIDLIKFRLSITPDCD